MARGGGAAPSSSRGLSGQPATVAMSPALAARGAAPSHVPPSPQSASSPADRAEGAQKAAAEPEAVGVSAYEAFTEHTYRLVFPHEDHFAKTPEPPLLTILESGVIESVKILRCQKGKGLIAYGFRQSLDDKTAHTKVEADSPLKGAEYCETPFVSKREDGTFCLVQTWPVSYNEKFKTDFKIFSSNPDPKKFDPQAVTEFKECMQRLFGEDASRLPVLFCHKSLVNVGPIFLGKAENLIELLERYPEKMQELAIKEVSSKSLSFVSDGIDGEGKRFEKTFTMAALDDYVMYKKVGWETLGCVKPKEQFLRESEFAGLPRQL